MKSREPIHALAWTAWLTATVIALTLTRNPLYLGLILLWLTVVTLTLRLTGEEKSDGVPLSPLRFGALVIPLATIFNALNVHVGTHVLFTLPLSLPLIGGPITLEAVAYGALNGLVLTGLLTAFLILNRALTVRALVGLIPRAYYPVAVIVSIAITFVPVTLQQFQRIREAQAIRGHRVRGMRSWLPLFLPLLMSGMERALQLAEAMTARGFASSRQEGYSVYTQMLLLAGLLSVGVGMVARAIWNIRLPGLILMLVGCGMILGVLWYIGRQQSRTTYRPARFHARDWLIVTVSLLMSLFFLPTNVIIDRASLFYYPYPTLLLPGFHIGFGVATWGVLLPALVLFATRVQPPSGISPGASPGTSSGEKP